MRKHHRFRPAAPDGLEERLVLSQVGLSQPHAVVASATTSTNVQFPTFNFQSVQQQVNQAFDTFRTNYKAAEASYLAVAGGGTATVPGINTIADLRGYTDQQISRLSTSLAGIFSLVPGGLTGLNPAVQAQLNSQYHGSLELTLDTIPDNTGSGGKPGTLYPQVSSLVIGATQLAVNDLLSAYYGGYIVGRIRGMFGGGAGQHGSPFNYGQVQSKLNQALSAFRTDYKAAESSFITAAGGGTATVPGVGSFADLKNHTGQQLGLLMPKLRGALNGVPGGIASRIGLAAFLNVQLDGPFSGSLGKALGLIPPTTGTNGPPGTLFPVISSDLLDVAQLAANNLLSAFNYGRILGLQSTGSGSAPFSYNHQQPLTPAQSAQLSQNAQAVQQAFTQFQSSYQDALNNTLFANATAGTNGQVDLTGNQAAFNAKVATALGTLNSAIGTALAGSVGASNTFLPAIQQALTGNGLTSLQGQLAALALPTDTAGTTANTYLNDVNTLVNNSYVDTLSRLNAFALNPNFSFNAFSANNAFLFGPYGGTLFNFPFTGTALTNMTLGGTTTA